MYKVINRKQILNDIQKIAKFSNSNFSIIKNSKLILFLKLKGFRHEYSSKIILTILELKKTNQLYNKITHHFKIPKFSVITIIYCS